MFIYSFEPKQSFQPVDAKPNIYTMLFISSMYKGLFQQPRSPGGVVYLYNTLIDEKRFINSAYKQYKKIMKLKVRTNIIGYDKISIDNSTTYSIRIFESTFTNEPNISFKEDLPWIIKRQE